MRTTLDLPDDLMRELKIRAAGEGRRLKDVVAEVLRQGLASRSGAVEESAAGSRNAESQPVSAHPASGLPVLPCRRSSGYRTATLAESLELIERANEEEDLHRAGLFD